MITSAIEPIAFVWIWPRRVPLITLLFPAIFSGFRVVKLQLLKLETQTWTSIVFGVKKCYLRRKVHFSEEKITEAHWTPDK